MQKILIISCIERILEPSEVWLVNFQKWRRRGGVAAPFFWKLKCEYFREESRCRAKTFIVNRYYNVCYAESVVFMFHQLLGSIIEIQILLQWRRGASRRHSVFGTLAKDRDLRARETFFRWILLFLYQFECVLSIFNLKTKFWYILRLTFLKHHYTKSCLDPIGIHFHE